MAEIVHVVRHRRTKLFVAIRTDKGVQGFWTRDLGDAQSFDRPTEAAAICHKYFPATKGHDFEPVKVMIQSNGYRMIEEPTDARPSSDT